MPEQHHNPQEVVEDIDQAVVRLEQFVKAITAVDTLKGMKLGHVWRTFEKARGEFEFSVCRHPTSLKVQYKPISNRAPRVGTAHCNF